MKIISESLTSLKELKNWAKDIMSHEGVLDDGLFGYSDRSRTAYYFYGDIDASNYHYNDCNKIMSYKATLMYKQSPLRFC